jgi:hypothetical protein
LLRQVLDLWRDYHRGQTAGFAAQASQLKELITHHLRDRPLKDPDNRRLLNELGGHNDRGNLLRFLDDPRIEPTNNRAERALRPAVMARKVSQCSTNARGAQTFAGFTSVVRTLEGRNRVAGGWVGARVSLREDAGRFRRSLPLKPRINYGASFASQGYGLDS